MKLRPNPNVLAQSLDEEIVILNTENDLTYGLDPVAANFWKALQAANGDYEEAFRTMIQRYDVEEQRLRSDLEELVVYLCEEQLLQEVA
jgi:hypothetical protein